MNWILKKSKNLKINYQKHSKKSKDFNLHFQKLKKKKFKVSKKFNTFWRKIKSLNKFWKIIKSLIKQKWWLQKRKLNRLNFIFKQSKDSIMNKLTNLKNEWQKWIKRVVLQQRDTKENWLRSKRKLNDSKKKSNL